MIYKYKDIYIFPRSLGVQRTLNIYSEYPGKDVTAQYTVTTDMSRKTPVVLQPARMMFPQEARDAALSLPYCLEIMKYFYDFFHEEKIVLISSISVALPPSKKTA